VLIRGNRAEWRDFRHSALSRIAYLTFVVEVCAEQNRLFVNLPCIVGVSPRDFYIRQRQQGGLIPTYKKIAYGELKIIRTKQAVGSRQALTKSDKKAGSNPR